MYTGGFLVILLSANLGRAQPFLVSFSLSLTPPELLTLTFNTALPNSSCDVSKLTLQNSSTLVIGGFYSPQEGSCSFVGGLTVTLNTTLSSSDWAAVQANLHLATDSGNAYISIQAGFLAEGSNSPISSSAALQVTPNLFSANTNPPAVVEALLDLDAGIITLRLYEGSTYTASAPLEFVDSTGSGGEITLTMFSTPNNVDFYFNLPILVLHSIKLAPPPFSISLPPALFHDGAGMTSPSQVALPVALIPDSKPPLIITFTIDLDAGQVDIIFDEPIDIDSVNLTGSMYLTNNFQGPEGAVIISGTVFTVENLNTELSFIVTLGTLNSVKFETTLCTSFTNCLLGVTATSFSDTSGNAISPSLSNIVATVLTEDMTQPELIAYTINLDSSSIAFTFSEPIDPQSFDPFGITLDIDINDLIMSGDDSIQYPPVSLGGASSIVDVTEKGTVFRIQLEASSLVDLKLLVTSGNIACSIEDFTAFDTNGNVVVPISTSASFQPSQIVLDQTSPVLVQFIAGPPEDMQLMFVFSELVDVSTWNISALTLTLLTTAGSYDYRLSAGFVETDSANTVTFTIDSSEYVFSGLMEHYQNAYVSGSLAVTARGSLVEDLFGNPLEPVMQPLLFNTTISGESPVLLSVDFDLNTGTLDLTYSDVVVAGPPAGRVRFQNDPVSPNHVLTLASNGTYSSLGEVGSSISLFICTEDLNSLKLNPYLATSSHNTFIVLADNFAYGLGSIQITPQNGTQVRTFIPDTQQPMVTRFELDLDSDTLSIEFSEPIQVYTFDETRIILLNSTTTPLSDAAHASLTGTYVLVQGNVTSLRALISVRDTVNIKRQPLCYSIENCFIGFDEALVSDVSGNVFLASVVPVQVNSVAPDVTPPQLVAFPEFDLDSGHFTLIFSEPVNGTSTDYAQVQFHNAPIDFNASVTLSEGITSPDHIEIDFHMSRGDLNLLKSNLDLCTNKEDCWIRLPSFFVNDIGMNPFIHSEYQSDVSASFHQPTVFIPDQTSPVLESASMDLDQGTLTLSFSEVIVEATFAPDDVTLLQVPFSLPRLKLSPSSVYSLTSSGAEVTIQLTIDDINWLKAQELSSFTHLSLVTNLIDVSGNAFQNITSSSGFQLTEVIQDQTRPQLVSFDYFNLENNSFLISFDEPVDVSTFDVTQVALVGQPSDGATSYWLTGAAMVTAIDGSLLSVMVVLTNYDRVQIKLISTLATVRGNTHIVLNSNSILDTSGNANGDTLVIPLSTGGYVPDTSQAGLSGFGLDLDSSLLFLTFNDVISSSSIDASLLIIQNKASSPSSSVALSHSSTPLNGSSDQVTISLSEGDLLTLKLDLRLATSESNTYISIDSHFATDVEGRTIIAIPHTSALPLTSTFIHDMTSPSLSSFSLDMNTGTLQLNFSEPILPSTVDPSQLTLHGQSSGGGSLRTLQQTTSLLTTTNTSLSVDLQLLQSDLNFLKDAPDLAIDTGTTFMSFTPLLVTDVTGNFIVAVGMSASIQAIRFTIDTTPPELRGFDADLTPVAKLYLIFSETVRFSGSIQTTISVTNAPVDPSVTIALTESDTSTQTGLDTVEISLSPPIITRLLVDTMIARSVDTLYLTLVQGVVEDTNGNGVIPADAYRVERLYKSCFSAYNNATLGECLECPSVCGDSCTGPDTIIGSGGCDSCSVLLLDTEGNQLTCTNPTLSTCPLGYFSTSLSSLATPLPPSVTESTLLCRQCDSVCSSCDGPTTLDCQTCSSAFFTNTTTARVECIQSCNQTSALDCITCHEQCSGCTGPSDRGCITCREDSIATDDAELVCVPMCTENMYLSQDNGVYACQPCHLECVGCKGNTNMECLRCSNVNLMANGSSMCLAVCPSCYYNSVGTCLSCHEYCVECTGPSNKNCTLCVDDEVEGEDGGKECVPTCSFGHEYDTTDEKCVLTREVYYLCIAAGGVGGTILLLPVVLVLVCCSYHFKKKKAKKGVFFVSATFDRDGQELRSLY